MSVGAMAPAGIADVQARIAAIQSRLGMSQRLPVITLPPSTSSLAGGAVSSGGTSTTTFADSLAEAVGTASGTGAVAPVPTSAAAAQTPATAGLSGHRAVELAKEYLGVPYVWGGTDPKKGLDCSGLTQLVFDRLGIDLPRVSRDQAKVGERVSSLSQAKPGDLLFFNDPVDHVAVYAGGGQMVHAPRRGKDVEVRDVYETPSVIRRVLPTASPAAASPVTATASPGNGAVPYADLFRTEAARAGVPAKLLAAVAKTESGFRPDAVSPAGARGLMQIMPATARGLGVDPDDPAQAVRGAARLIAGYLKDYDGDVELTLAAYNAGPGNVRKYGGVPPFAETQAYVRKVQDAMQEVAL